MKKLVLLLVMLVATSTFAQDTDLRWFTNFEQAKTVAKQEKKPILMYFTGSDWCGYCRLLKKDFFESEKFKEAADKVVLVMVDIPRREDIISKKQRKANMKLVKRYNKKKSFPLVVGFNKRGKRVSSIASYSMLRDSDRYFRFLDKLRAMR